MLFILAVPALYWIAIIPLALGISAALKLMAPDLRGTNAWPVVLAMSMVALVVLLLIFRHGLQGIAGLSRQEKWRCRFLVLLPFYIPLLMLSGPEFSFPGASLPVLAALLHCFLIGFSEEVIFRGYVQSALIQRFRGKRGGIVFAVLLSSAVFGMMHLVNGVGDIDVGPGFTVELEMTAQSWANALVQAVYATLFGILFGAVLLKSNKLWPLILMHALVDFPSSLQTMTKAAGAGSSKREGSPGAENLVIELGGIIVTAPLLVAGLLILRTIKPADIAPKLETTSERSPKQGI